MTNYNEYREHLKTITNGLREMAKAAGRGEVEDNKLLRECYNLVGIEMDTHDGWDARGGKIKNGQHAYLFWKENDESTNNDGFGEVEFLYAREQVDFEEKPNTTLFAVLTEQYGTQENDGAGIVDDRFYTSRAEANKKAKEIFQREIDNEDTWTHDIWFNSSIGDEHYHIHHDETMGEYEFSEDYEGKIYSIRVITLEGKL